jgi:hypothetical protein
MPSDADPSHSIVARSWEYELVEFCYQRDVDNQMNSSIDLTLSREGVCRRLRFRGVQDVTFEEGMPPLKGLCIYDLSERQLERLKVRVGNLEAGGLRFWANDVIDLDDVAILERDK